jgi:rod shape-determining protein MreD
MFWPAYFILAYVAVGLQIGLGPFLRVGGAIPNFVLMCVVFIAVNAPREPALLGCFALGVMQDLVSADTLGLYALSYGLFALMAAGSGQAVHRGHPLTHFALTLGGGLIAAFVLLIHSWLPFTRAPHLNVGTMLWSAVYSALWAPFIIWPLHRMHRSFGFQPPRRRVRV